MVHLESPIGVNTDMHQWILKNQQDISMHQAWHGNVSEAGALDFLKDARPYTFILRNGDREHSYFITFVKKDGGIKHQSFVLELGRKGWLYKNGFTDGLLEAVAKDVADLIPLMMHCETRECIPLAQ